MSVYDWNTNASSNTSVGGVSISEGMNPAGVNNAVREVMAAVAAFSAAPVVADLETAGETTFRSAIETIYVNSYAAASPGKGGALYKKASSEPSHSGKFQDGSNVWWEIAEAVISPEMFGAVGDGSTNDTAAVQGVYDFATLYPGTEVLLIGRYKLTSTVYIRGDGIVTRAATNRYSGFVGGAASGFLQVGDDTDLGNIYRPGGVRFHGVYFDGNFTADVALWLGYRINEPMLFDCRFGGAKFATIFVDQDVTEVGLHGCSSTLSGQSASFTAITLADCILSWGNGHIYDSNIGTCSGWGVRVVCAGSNPWGDISIVEENHIGVYGGRITSAGLGFVKSECKWGGDLVVNSVSGTFQRGETITGSSSGATGIYWRTINGTVRMFGVTGAFTTSDTITGGTSGATAGVTTANVSYANQGGKGITRVKLHPAYMENPGNYAGQDGDDVNLSGEFAIVAQGRNTVIEFDGGGNNQFRKAQGFLAQYDSLIKIRGGCTFTGQTDVAGQEEFVLAATAYASGDLGIAKVDVSEWAGVFQSIGAEPTGTEIFEPFTGWAGLFQGGPCFAQDHPGIIGPRMQHAWTVMDGTTLALTNFTDPAGSTTVDTSVFKTRGASLKWTGDGATAASGGLAFDKAPPPELIGKRVLFVATCNWQQVGAQFGTANGVAPRLQVASAAGSDKIWPDPATSYLNQNLTAPGAGNRTGWFRISTAVYIRSGDALRFAVNNSRADTASDDIFNVDTIECYLLDDPTPSLGGSNIFPISSMRTLHASATWDPGSIANGAEEAVDLTVYGAALGDFVIPSFTVDVADLALSASVTATNTVTLVLSNNTGGSVDLASGTAAALVIKAPT